MRHSSDDRRHVCHAVDVILCARVSFCRRGGSTACVSMYASSLLLYCLIMAAKTYNGVQCDEYKLTHHIQRVILDESSRVSWYIITVTYACMRTVALSAQLSSPDPQPHDVFHFCLPDCQQLLHTSS